MTDLPALLTACEREGRRAVVGALIRDSRGHVFVHRRGPDRRILPNCWDIVGGHVDSGEDLLQTLSREIEEETGWKLRGDPVLFHVEEWVGDGDDGPGTRREFDFLVEVEGDLDRPRLERPKHVEFRWIGPDDLPILDENRANDHGLIRRIVTKALASART